jgi:phage-related minor tail protein
LPICGFVANFAQNSNEKVEKTANAFRQTAKDRQIHGLQDIAQILKFV